MPDLVGCFPVVQVNPVTVICRRCCLSELRKKATCDLCRTKTDLGWASDVCVLGVYVKTHVASSLFDLDPQLSKSLAPLQLLCKSVIIRAFYLLKWTGLCRFPAD